MVGMDIVESRLSGPPSLTEVFGRYSITWPLSDGLEVVVTADRLRVHSDRVTASVRVAATPAGHETLHLSYSTVNVASAQSRRGLARDLEARFKTNGLEWDSIIEVSSRMLLEALEAGSPPERLTHTEHTRPEHLLHPLVLAGLPTLLYSPGGQGKSWVAMFVAILLENGINFEGGTGRKRAHSIWTGKSHGKKRAGEQRLSPTASDDQIFVSHSTAGVSGRWPTKRRNSRRW